MLEKSYAKICANAYFICALSASFYCYEFFLQVSPGVMTHELMRDYSLDAASLGVVAAAYYYAYMPMMIIAGMLYDRLGPRLLLTIATLVCASGAFLFACSYFAVLAGIGRFLMGGGSAFAFIGTLVLISRWCPPKQFALLVGFTQLLGSIGAIFGETPLSLAVATFGWRETLLFMAGIGVLLAVVLVSFIRDRPPGQTVPKAGQLGHNEWHNLKTVLCNPQIVWIALYSFLSWAPMPVFAALWGVPFLVTRYPISDAQGATLCVMAWIGVATTSPFIGWLSDRIHRRCVLTSTCALFGIISMFCAIYMTTIPIWLMGVCIFGLGFAASGQSLAFALVKDNTHPYQVGTAIGFVNMCVVAGGAFFQPLVGFILKRGWSGEMIENAPVYSVSDYRKALLIIPICYTIAWLVSKLKLEETHCKPQWNTGEQ